MSSPGVESASRPELPARVESRASGSAAPRGRRVATLLLSATEPAAAAGPEPITVGVCTPRGAVTAGQALELCDAWGRPVELQQAPTAYWPDGSVKWMLLDFLKLPANSVSRQAWNLIALSDETSHGPEHRAATGRAPRLGLKLAGDRVLIAEPAPAGMARSGPTLAELHVLLTLADGRVSRPRLEHSAWEVDGPVRSTLRLEGVFSECRGLEITVRLSLFAGTGCLRASVRLRNRNRARHRGGLWDLGDPGSVLFKSLSVRVEAGPGQVPQEVAWSLEPGATPRTSPLGPLEIYQDSSGGEHWNSPNHRNREGRVPCRFRGGRLRTPDGEAAVLRPAPTVAVGGGDWGWAAALPEFWQQFPKALAVDGRTLEAGLFPAQWGDLFELQGGEQKTHTVWLSWSSSAAAAHDELTFVHRPTRAGLSSDSYAQAGVFASFLPGEAKLDARFQAILDEALAGPHSLAARREVIDEYGWRNFGDMWADHEGAYYQGPPPVISHYNNQFDLLSGLIQQGTRSGDPRWLDQADPLARHVADIDIYHTQQDRAAYNGGLFWHTDHYADAATATHRTYSAANQPPGRPYGGGPSNEHNYTTGLLSYYYLTGCPEAREAVLSLAQWVLAMDDGGSTFFSEFDSAPTGLAIATTERDYHGPGRGAGNSVNALLDGWQLTAERRFLAQAELLIRRVVHPHEDVDRLDLLNVELRWSYTVFLSALSRYLDLKHAAGDFDDNYDYAAASLLHYARWMLANERPYFDRPDQLEYPTETWAAQELRKANVLRLAAAYAPEPLAAQLLARGLEFAERAWADLFRFESKCATRPLAILLQEGMRDSAFRSAAAPERRRPPRELSWPSHEPFVAQRQRVLQKLKTLPGMLELSWRLANPRLWPRLAHRIWNR